MIDLTPVIRHAAILTSLILVSSSIYINPAQSQQRACVITDEGTTVCGKPTTSKKKTQETTQDNQNTESFQEFRLDNYVFSLKECKQFFTGSGMDAACKLTVVNNGTERKLSIIASSQRNPSIMNMTDTTGEKYTPRAWLVSVGEKRGEDVTFKTTSGNSYPISIQFRGVPRSVDKAQDLYLSISIDETPRLVHFTDVDIKPRTRS